MSIIFLSLKVSITSFVQFTSPGHRLVKLSKASFYLYHQDKVVLPSIYKSLLESILFVTLQINIYGFSKSFDF